ncbi:adenylyltransferase/cytidyltransferase family protein [Candidatus Dojkabacteria bacterium]|jgi:cytidyltransferase-like protein|nr:adenylyltransferase/cytidyltransferase family protein [Candidatus Dojkabacteria bacterium]
MTKVEEELSLPTLKYLVKDLRKHGKTIGFTHGTFDLFHAGHLHLLKESSKKCDFLIVGIDSDSMVSKYKAKGRPIIKEEDRLDIINNLNIPGTGFILRFDKLLDNKYANLYRDLQINKLFVGYNFPFIDKAKKRLDRIGSKLNVIYGYRNHTSFIINNILKTQS